MAASLSNGKETVIRRLTACLKDDLNVSFAFVFGSFMKERRKRPKDIDLAVFFDKPTEGSELLTFITMLSNATGEEIDLVVLNRASAFLRHQVVKTGRPVLIKDKEVYRRFREKTIEDFDEYRFISGLPVYDR